MNREGMSVIPRGAWTVAGLLSGALMVVFILIVTRNEATAGRWPDLAKALFMFGIPLVLFCYVILVGFVYGDAQRRGMRHVLWTLLVIFIPNAIGFILYFILRDPLLTQCTQCGADLRRGFTYCPKCGTPRTQTCPQCHRQVEPGWTHCAQCGMRL